MLFVRGDVCEAASPGAGRVQPSCWKLSSPQWDSEHWCLEKPCPQSPFSLPLFLLSIPSCPCSLVHLPHTLTSSLFLPKFSFPCHSHSQGSWPPAPSPLSPPSLLTLLFPRVPLFSAPLFPCGCPSAASGPPASFFWGSDLGKALQTPTQRGALQECGRVIWGQQAGWWCAGAPWGGCGASSGGAAPELCWAGRSPCMVLGVMRPPDPHLLDPAELAPFPAACRSLQTCYQVSMRWTEPPSLAVFIRAGGSSSLSKFGSFHLRCAAERRRGKSSGGETWRLFRLVVVFLYWILGASLSISPPFFLGRLSIILAEMKAPSAGNF